MQPPALYSSVIRVLTSEVNEGKFKMDTTEPITVNAKHIHLFKETVFRSLDLRRDSSDVLRKCSCPQGQHQCRREVMVDELEESDLPELFHPLSQGFIQERVSLIYIILQ
jgi:hypothetical protein